ncbi:MAG: SAM-dependent methyltransferase [Steroidobacteraceae bacterium]
MRRNDTGMSPQRVLGRNGAPVRERSSVGREIRLSTDEVQHTRRVAAYLADEIAASGGWIGFERYMEIVLYAPGLGYYSAGARKLGPGGDFTTAPEISSLFGACVAQQCADVLRDLGGGSIMEIGAGSGGLAADILSRLDALGRLPKRYLMLDVSADLRGRQQRTLGERVPHLLPLVRWLSAPPTDSFDGVVLANEVLDALPVSRIRWHATHCEELGVAVTDNRFHWAPRPAGDATAAVCAALAAAGGGWEDGYVTEYCPRLKAWAAELVRALNAGVALWFDYGLPRSQYYFPERRDGTLMCHFRHRAHEDPFLHPGLQDITAWVDFTALAEACRPAACELAGFTTQAYFLAGLGIDREMQDLAGGDANCHARLANQARRLMLPGEMGERFKAMAWSRNLDVPLRGFGLRDLRHAL